MTTLNYERPSSATTITTGIEISAASREFPNGLVDIALGTTGVYEVEIKADADESAGFDIQALFKIQSTLTIANDTGAIRLAISVTPVGGDGIDNAAQQLTTVEHDSTMDTWQTDAGRARQP